MAEEVEIGNVGGTGVASEATLARLTASIEAMARKAGIDPKAEAAKLQKLHNTAVKSGITTFDNSQKAQKANTKAVGEATQATNQFARRLGGAMLGAIGTAVGAIKGLGNEILQGGESFGDITKHIPLFGSAIAPLAGLIDNSIETFCMFRVHMLTYNLHVFATKIQCKNHWIICYWIINLDKT